MAGLLNKLRMMDAAGKKPAPKTEAQSNEQEHCYHKTFEYPLTLFCDRRHATPAILEKVFECSFPKSISPEDVLFLDSETTGLSGGVGTIAFQVGIGYFTQSSFVVEQLLMHDYPQEAELLTILCSRMRRFSVICTFNGKSFDIPLLRTRLVMNRMKDDCIPSVHADVLYPARRLWKLRLKQCTLGRLENQLLGVEREDDLPGALVPQAYFQYLKDRQFGPMERVLEHNRQDIVSLAQLFYELCRQMDQPESIEQGEDLLSLARMCERSGDIQRAVKCYRLCANGDTRADAYRALSVTAKRQGNTEAAIKLCKAMLNRGDDPIYAYEALAKLYEHQLRKPEQALHYTRQALLLLAEPSLVKTEAVQEKQIALQYRYARLRRKLSQCVGAKE
ncbi:MAG: tetratricopeptide repeat protein [Clostridiales bacterium]|nr:tetratricopeptide repeat protein [Clostridiales bacterium]